ncbi:CU044_2847 family protein [Microbacterium sp. LS_15]|uniref:CU044_2847 family protein n=1 Tax=Microbacterium sp. LS_15 TaxID=3055790 RepID=UPI0035BFD7B3
MSQHIITDEGGRPLFTIEVAQPAESPLRGGVDGFVSTTADNVREVGQAIAKLCDDVMTSVKASITAASPDELELTFGVSLGGEASIPLVTKATSEATFTVRALWRDTGAGKEE